MLFNDIEPNSPTAAFSTPVNNFPAYWLYEMSMAGLNPIRAIAEANQLLFSNPINPWAHTQFGKSVAAGMQLFERATRRYGRPDWEVSNTVVDGKIIPVEIVSVWEKPFGRLLNFRRQLSGEAGLSQTKLIIFAPMAGHFATVLQGTVKEFLPDYDVYITEWMDARMIPLELGNFDLEDYIDYVISVLNCVGRDAHVVAVCQSAVPLLAAVALLEAEGNPNVPKSATLISGTLDTRVNPTAVNRAVKERGFEWFKRNTITKVPFPHPGVSRDVYPGFFQLNGFINLDLDRELNAHRQFFRSLVTGDASFVTTFTEFYDEFLAVMDLSADFFLQTVDHVFIRHTLATGEMTHRNIPVDPGRIRRVALMTIEAEYDRIASIGQTRAAHELCANINDARRAHYVQPDVGHYGVFNGSLFSSGVLPRINQFIRDQDRGGGL